MGNFHFHMINQYFGVQKILYGNEALDFSTILRLDKRINLTLTVEGISRGKILAAKIQGYDWHLIK